MSQIVVAYIPVLHRGYQLFLEKYSHADEILLIGRGLIGEFDYLAKDIRALLPTEIQTMLMALKPELKVRVIEAEELGNLPADAEIIMPDEDTMHSLVDKYLPVRQITYDTIFLRWEKGNMLKKALPVPDEVVTDKDFDREMMALAATEEQKSADWWRQVGGVAVKDGEVIFSVVNHHVPHVQQPYADGDPRGNFHKGENIDLTTALHAEQDIIVQAAKNGISLDGASIYITTFPCPVCAKLVAYSGIKRVYYRDGYAMLDGQSILKANEVELVRVK